MITVYSTTVCNKCKQLKATLADMGVDYKEVDMSLPEALTELRINGVFTISAPVLQVDDEFYTIEDMFNGDTIKNIEVLL